MKQIIITREENQKLHISRVLAIFRDKDLILSLEDMAYYLKMYENQDKIIIKVGDDNLDDIFSILIDEGINFKIEE